MWKEITILILLIIFPIYVKGAGGGSAAKPDLTSICYGELYSNDFIRSSIDLTTGLYGKAYQNGRIILNYVDINYNYPSINTGVQSDRQGSYFDLGTEFSLANNYSISEWQDGQIYASIIYGEDEDNKTFDILKDGSKATYQYLPLILSTVSTNQSFIPQINQIYIFNLTFINEDKIFFII